MAHLMNWIVLFPRTMLPRILVSLAFIPTFTQTFGFVTSVSKIMRRSEASISSMQVRCLEKQKQGNSDRAFALYTKWGEIHNVVLVILCANPQSTTKAPVNNLDFAQCGRPSRSTQPLHVA